MNLQLNKRSNRAGGACGSNGGRRPRKRPRHPGDIPSVPAPVKQEVSEDSSPAEQRPVGAATGDAIRL